MFELEPHSNHPNPTEPPPPQIVQKCVQEMQPLVEKDYRTLDPDIREAQQNPHGFDGMKGIEDMEKVWESQKKHCESDKDMELCSLEIKMGRYMSASLADLCLKKSCVDSQTQKWLRDKAYEHPQVKGMEFELTCSAYKMGWSFILILATAILAS
mmetsp:Transcript_18505/g.43469  ORF Transcript_18505/g.43469 Transcript_18505/m.43469 type:complete len:155 (-) Transcript_18505:19-483(-)